MHISENLKEYLYNSKIVCKSNIIITDLENIKLVEFIDNNTITITSNDKLSNNIFDLIKIWNSYNIDKSNLFCIMNYYCIKLIENDTNNYSAQMIFPLFNKNNKLLYSFELVRIIYLVLQNLLIQQSNLLMIL